MLKIKRSKRKSTRKVVACYGLVDISPFTT